MLIGVLIENLKVVEPDGARVATHDLARLGNKLLFASDSMGIDHHEHCEGRLGHVCKLLGHAKCFAEQFTPFREWGQVNSTVRCFVERFFF